METRLHAKELAASEVRHERTTLADRLREDYGIDLAALDEQPTPEGLEERQQVEAEIADLRAKLNSIGGVNLDALSEVEELEARFASLSSQRDDLTSAKNSLAQIIGKIDADSRELFSQTLETVREHFPDAVPQIVRRRPGGNRARRGSRHSGERHRNRRPTTGKEPRNISLLSGGEKTLTCVALLLAIFRSRPSPFCVLDEVDAALDEANIERFLAVLREFLAWTQFIVVTHSKKTMVGAETLYESPCKSQACRSASRCGSKTSVTTANSNVTRKSPNRPRRPTTRRLERRQCGHPRQCGERLPPRVANRYHRSLTERRHPPQSGQQHGFASIRFLQTLARDAQPLGLRAAHSSGGAKIRRRLCRRRSR